VVRARQRRLGAAGVATEHGEETLAFNGRTGDGWGPSAVNVRAVCGLQAGGDRDDGRDPGTSYGFVVAERFCVSRAAAGTTVKTEAVNPDDGSCNSCHRNKSGSVTGTIAGDTLTLTMFFAAGVHGDPTPACSATLSGSATMLAEGRVSGRYTGADTCEGPFTNGTLAMRHQP
jgi:hypothetical protein